MQLEMLHKHVYICTRTICYMQTHTHIHMHIHTHIHTHTQTRIAPADTGATRHGAHAALASGVLTEILKSQSTSVSACTRSLLTLY
jgi:hypothetical protein